MNPQLIYVGVTHKTTPLSVRERMLAEPESFDARLAQLNGDVDECAMITTCGRIELYAVAPQRDRPAWLQRFASLIGVSPTLAGRHARFLSGRRAARHLLRVAAGLESQIAGDEQIVGQVREAFQSAVSARCAGPVLSALFRAAIHAGKRVRRETAIFRTTRSFADAAVKHVKRGLDLGASQTVLIIGSGNLAESVVTELSHHSPGRIVIVSRYVDRARELARRCGGIGTSTDLLPAWLNRADAVISCTSSPRHFVMHDMIRRDGPDVTIVDLGVPRNVAPSVGRIGRVRLCPLDHLAPASVPEPGVIAAAGEIVAEELERFVKWQRGRDAATRIVEVIRRSGGTQASADDKRCLHRAITRLRDGERAA